MSELKNCLGCNIEHPIEDFSPGKNQCRAYKVQQQKDAKAKKILLGETRKCTGECGLTKPISKFHGNICNTCYGKTKASRNKEIISKLGVDDNGLQNALDNNRHPDVCCKDDCQKSFDVNLFKYDPAKRCFIATCRECFNKKGYYTIYRERRAQEKYPNCHKCDTVCKLCQICHSSRAVFGNESSGFHHCVLHKTDLDDLKARSHGHLCIKCEMVSKYFGPVGSKSKHCSRCKEVGDVATYSPVCEFDTCCEIARYGFPTEILRWCSLHTPKVAFHYIKKNLCKTCLHVIASYGTEQGNPVHCLDHKMEKEWNVIKKSCLFCDKEAVFAPLGEKVLHCIDHKLDGDIHIYRQCIVCYKKPRKFGSLHNEIPLHCEDCTTDSDIYITNDLYACTSCDLKFCKIPDSLCPYCDLVPLLTRRSFEKDIAAFLVEKFNSHSSIINIVLDKSVGGSSECGRFRPDILLNFQNFSVIVEIDEFQHLSYNHEEETLRMNSISWQLERSVIFIRYNPHSFKTRGVKFDLEPSLRKEKLNETILQIIDNGVDNVKDLVVKLFFDGYE